MRGRRKLAYLLIGMVAQVVFSLTPAYSFKYLHVEDSGFTRLAVSARAMGMGEAFVAVADDYSACYYNPAGLVNLSSREVGSMYTDLYGLGLLTHSYLNFTEPNTGLGSGAVSWSHLSADLEPGKWTYDLWAYSYAQRFSLKSSWGINLKYLRQETSWEDASGYSIDLAYMRKEKKISWGIRWQNVFSKIDWGTGHKDTLPASITAGIALTLNPAILIALDSEFSSRDLPRSIHLGGELKMGRYFSLRAGLINKFQPAQTLTLTTGVGFKIGFAEINSLSFDYAFLSPQELPSTHYFSFSLAF